MSVSDPDAMETVNRFPLESAPAVIPGLLTVDGSCAESHGPFHNTSQLREALAVAERMPDYQRHAGLGPWTQLAREGQRLQLLARLGRYDEVLDALDGLRRRMAELPDRSDQPETAIPFNVREVILDTGRLAARDARRWEQALELNAERLELKRRRGASPLELAKFANLLEHGRRDRKALSPRSVRYLHAIVRRALSDARRWGLVVRNVADQADPPRPDRNREAMRVWSAEQVRSFLEHVRGDRLYALWLLLATTGMRRGEACGLSWDDIDLGAARIAVRRNLTAVRGRGQDRVASWSEPKTSKSRRSVAIDTATAETLRAHRKFQLEERLAAGPAYVELGLAFCREDGSELDPDWVSKRFERLVVAAGVPRIRLHDLRHTHATLALQAGVHVKVVSERLGHATVGMTLDTYSHVIPALGEDAAAKVAALMLGD